MQAQPTHRNGYRSRAGGTAARALPGDVAAPVAMPRSHAPGPSPIQVDGLSEAQRRARAEEVLAGAEAAGAPLLNRLGRRRSPITLPEYQRGRRPANAGRKFPGEPLGVEEIAALLAAAGNGITGVRARALIAVLWRAGLRIAEALALEPKDVDLENGTIAVLHGKGAKRRIVGLDPVAVSFLAPWLEARDRLRLSVEAPLFCTIARDRLGPGRPISSSAFRESLKRYARRAGIRKRVHPHGLRHTHAFELVTEGVPVHIVRAQLGHADLAMTQHYIDHLAPTALIKALREREWPTQLAPPTRSVPRAAASQREPARTSGPTVVPGVLARDRPAPPTTNRRGAPAAPGEALRRVLDLLAANGGRASQTQITRALGVTKGRTSQLISQLYANGLIISAGVYRESGQAGRGSRIWRLAPSKARFTLDHPPGPREHVAPPARRGYGRQRVLEVVAALGGRASQVEIARQLGISAPAVAKHCQTLEQQGKLTRAGLDKSTSNRGSQRWRIAPPQRPGPSPSLFDRAGWRQLSVVVPRPPAH